MHFHELETSQAQNPSPQSSLGALCCLQGCSTWIDQGWPTAFMIPQHSRCHHHQVPVQVHRSVKARGESSPNHSQTSLQGSPLPALPRPGGIQGHLLLASSQQLGTIPPSAYVGVRARRHRDHTLQGPCESPWVERGKSKVGLATLS